MTDYSPEAQLRRALRQRASLRQEVDTAHRKAADLEHRVTVLETALADVWRWTNDGHPHLELLTPILERAQTDHALTEALNQLQLTRQGPN